MTLIAMFAALLLIAGVTLAAAPRNKYHLVWSDGFNGAANTLPNSAVWTAVQGGSGWGNGELECYTDVPGNVSENGLGDLVITALSDPGHICSDGATDGYTSARIETQGKKSFKYGKIEVRAEMPTGSGTWPAIWMLGADYPTVNWPDSGEIDISEIVGSHPNNLHGSIHGALAGSSTEPYDVTRDHVMSALPSAGFHVYGITWSKNQIIFTLDGTSYFTVTPKTTGKNAWPFNKPFYLLLNLAVGGTFPGSPNASATWPQRMLVDWVRVYQT